MAEDAKDVLINELETQLNKLRRKYATSQFLNQVLQKKWHLLESRLASSNEKNNDLQIELDKLKRRSSVADLPVASSIRAIENIMDQVDEVLQIKEEAIVDSPLMLITEQQPSSSSMATLGYTTKSRQPGHSRYDYSKFLSIKSRFKCSHCSYATNSGSNLKRHQYRRHDRVYQPSSKPKPKRLLKPKLLNDSSIPMAIKCEYGYKCAFEGCEAKYTISSNANRHFRRAHQPFLEINVQ